jgi:hypothetical protein
MLLHDEVARRDQKKLHARLVRAGFGLGKTLETFFGRLPKLNRAYSTISPPVVTSTRRWQS